MISIINSKYLKHNHSFNYNHYYFFEVAHNSWTLSYLFSPSHEGQFYQVTVRHIWLRWIWLVEPLKRLELSAFETSIENLTLKIDLFTTLLTINLFGGNRFSQHVNTFCGETSLRSESPHETFWRRWLDFDSSKIFCQRSSWKQRTHSNLSSSPAILDDIRDWNDIIPISH